MSPRSRCQHIVFGESLLSASKMVPLTESLPDERGLKGVNAVFPPGGKRSKVLNVPHSNVCAGNLIRNASVLGVGVTGALFSWTI